MDKNKMSSPNMHIGCNVNECKYHGRDQAYCTLDKIMVVKHHDAKTIECTDCGSFEIS